MRILIVTIIMQEKRITAARIGEYANFFPINFSLKIFTMKIKMCPSYFSFHEIKYLDGELKLKREAHFLICAKLSSKDYQNIR